MSKQTPFIVTIDGPSASGKTSVARELARRFGLFHIRGGTFLRAFALFTLKSRVNPDNPEELARLLENFHLEVIEQDNSLDYLIFLNGECVQEQMWTPGVDAIVSATSRHLFVRSARIKWKQTLAVEKRLIADGRTLGSEVFPYANLKIFLTASLEERAQRRFMQYTKTADTPVSIEEIRSHINIRDTSDALGELNRTLTYPDQYVIDSTNHSFHEITERISTLIKAVGKTQ